jgi:hypothetical protein
VDDPPFIVVDPAYRHSVAQALFYKVERTREKTEREREREKESRTKRERKAREIEYHNSQSPPIPPYPHTPPPTSPPCLPDVAPGVSPKFFLGAIVTAAKASGQPPRAPIDPRLLSAVGHYKRALSSGVETTKAAPRGEAPVGLPIHKLEGLQQSMGEAKFTSDLRRYVTND